MALDIKKIIQYPLKADQFFDEEQPKTQIVIHHTAGNASPIVVIDGWNNNLDKIGTPFVIAGKPKDKNSKWQDGDIYQCFSSKKYAYHLGIPSETFKQYNIPYQRLDKIAIGIELCNWGYLTKQADGTFKNYVGGIVPAEEVTDLGSEFRGYQFYHSYTDSQLNSLRDLIIYLCDKYNIPKTYNENIWDINQAALNGQSGIFSHTSYRKDKYDCSPQPKLITMLKELSNQATDQSNS